ncbi:MAG: phenylacetate--CoA ligase family protein [Saprospiraceae bacterium]
MKNRLTNLVLTYAPFWFQNLAISVFGYFWKKRRFGKKFDAEVKKFIDRENFTSDQWKAYQTRELRKIVVSAFDNVPFYTEKYTKAGLTRLDLMNITLDTISKIPPLEKEELRNFGKSTLLSNKLDKSGRFYSSSGSTGKPVSIFLSKKSHQFWTAGYEARVKNWAGVSKAMRRGMIGGRRILPKADSSGPYYRWNYFEKMVYFSAYHISAKTAADYVSGIRKYKLDFMMGYAMSNYLLANFIIQENLEVPKLKAVITSSEKLTDEMRSVYKKAYGCETYDTWSGVEAVAQISECEKHTLHESPDIGIIEVLDENGNQVLPGEMGEAYCTSLYNFDQPLIRYRCGDQLRVSNKDCECGRSLRTFEEISGRIEDIIEGKDGRKMVRFHGVFIDLEDVIEAQVIQFSLEEIEIKVVSSKEILSEKSIATMINRMQSQLGDIKVIINQVDGIPRGPNGKFKAVISKL